MRPLLAIGILILITCHVYIANAARQIQPRELANRFATDPTLLQTHGTAIRRMQLALANPNVGVVINVLAAGGPDTIAPWGNYMAPPAAITRRPDPWALRDQRHYLEVQILIEIAPRPLTIQVVMIPMGLAILRRQTTGFTYGYLPRDEVMGGRTRLAAGNLEFAGELEARLPELFELFPLAGNHNRLGTTLLNMEVTFEQRLAREGVQRALPPPAQDGIQRAPPPAQEVVVQRALPLPAQEGVAQRALPLPAQEDVVQRALPPPAQVLDDNCTICLEPFNASEETFVTQCNHSFHASCFNGWIGHGNSNCPLCRRVV